MRLLDYPGQTSINVALDRLGAGARVFDDKNLHVVQRLLLPLGNQLAGLAHVDGQRLAGHVIEAGNPRTFFTYQIKIKPFGGLSGV